MVDESAHPELCCAIGNLPAHPLAGRSDEAAVVGIRRRGCGKRKVGIFVDGAHPRCFLLPILSIVLNDTKGIDPEIPRSHLTGECHDVLEGLWKSGPGNAMLVLSQRRRCRPQWLYSAPAVAETEVACAFAMTDMQFYILRVTHTSEVQDPCWEKRLVTSRALVVYNAGDINSQGPFTRLLRRSVPGYPGEYPQSWRRRLGTSICERGKRMGVSVSTYL